MSRTQDNQPNQNVLRAENIINSAAHSVGYLWGSTRLRLKDATKAIQVKGDQMNHPTAEQAKNQTSSPTGQTTQSQATTAEQTDTSRQPDQVATKRAEEMIDDLGASLGIITAGANFFVRRTIARVREEAEDIYAESQNILHHNNQPPSK